MSFSSMVAGITAVSLLLGIGNLVWTWLSKGGAKTAEHERRIQAIEGELKHLPNKDDVNHLRLQMADVNGKLNTAEAELGSVARTVRRIEEHLLGAK